MNNKTIIFLVLHFGLLLHLQSQVAIGKDTPEGDGLMDFAQNDHKGIILPTNNTLSNELGSIAFLREDGKIYYNDNNGKQPLTGFEPVELNKIKPEELPNNDDEDQGVIIGSHNSDAKGVLILESLNQALILPRVNDVQNNMVNPEPGTICYDITSKSIALFDGTNWYFWNHLKNPN